MEIVIPWQFCRTIGPLMFHSQEMGACDHYEVCHVTPKLSLVSKATVRDGSGLMRNWLQSATSVDTVGEGGDLGPATRP